MMISAQVLSEMCTGAMKSLTADVNESDDRDLTYADENGAQSPGATIPAAVRSMAASPNVNARAVPGDGDWASGLVRLTRLTSASPVVPPSAVGPLHVPLACQVRKASVGFCAPPRKS